MKIECNVSKVFPCEWVKAIASFRRLSGIFVRVLHQVSARDLVLYREFPAGEPHTVVNADPYVWSSRARGVDWKKDWVDSCRDRGIDVLDAVEFVTFCNSRDLLVGQIWSEMHFADVLHRVLTGNV